MPLTTSLYTGLSGMKTNSQLLDVVGNNISNVNTTGFKRSRATFETQISQTIANGSAPSSILGGTNPAQVGLGVRMASITRDFADGGLQPTGVATHMAIEGNGFFIVEEAGAQRYTRDGTFSLDRDFNLVTSGGSRVQGFGVDSQFEIVEGLPQDVTIPIGVLTIAEATKNVSITGNLDAEGVAATQGTILTSNAMYSDATATTPAVSGDALTALFNAGGTALFATGDIITFTDITRGGATIPDKTFEIGGTNTTGSDGNGTTLADLATFMEGLLGIDATQAGVTGVTVTALGELQVSGNIGDGNALLIDPGFIVVNQSIAPTTPMSWTESQAANGESVRTSFIAYDSLGSVMSIDMTVVLENKTGAGTSWRFYTHAEDDTDLATFLGSGTLTFDNDGQFIAAANSSFVINRANTGALDPQTVTLDFAGQSNLSGVSALDSETSQISSPVRDGSPIGTLQDFSVDQDGTLWGVFSNSQLRKLGRIPMAMFSNNEGLQGVGGNLYTNTANSGTPQIVSPGSSGSGLIIGRTIELSNVDLSEEFINLIGAQTGFSANSRVISTSQQLIQQLLQTI